MRWVLMIRAAVLLAAAVFGLGTLWSAVAECPSPSSQHTIEAYDPRLARIRSMDQAERLIRARLPAQPSTAQIVEATDAFVQARFYHDLSVTRLCDENWVASVAGLVWDRFRYPVRRDSILKHTHAQCAQQMLVFTGLLERFGVPYGFVRYGPLHLAAMARVDGQWLVYDPNQEIRAGGVPLGQVLDGSALPSAYPFNVLGRFGNLGENYRRVAQAGRMSVEGVNENIAARGMAIESTMLFFSRYGWILFGLMAVAMFAWPKLRRRRRAANADRVEPPKVALADALP